MHDKAVANTLAHWLRHRQDARTNARRGAPVACGLLINVAFLALSAIGAFIWHDWALNYGTVMLALFLGVGLAAKALAHRNQLNSGAVTCLLRIAGGRPLLVREPADLAAIVRDVINRSQDDIER